MARATERTEQPAWTVQFYRDSRGRSPIEDWLNALHDPRGTIRARIDATLIRLREAGGRLPEPYVKHLRDKLWELRWHVGGEYLRVIFATVKGRIILLLCGFTKKEQRTPVRELELALRRLTDWSERHEGKQEGPKAQDKRV